MTTFSPEGRLIHTEQNKALCRSPAGLWEALRTGAILEARAFLCTQQHDLLVDFSFCQGLIPRQEGALGVASSPAGPPSSAAGSSTFPPCFPARSSPPESPIWSRSAPLSISAAACRR